MPELDNNPLFGETREKIPFANQIVVATNCLYKNYKILAEGEQRPEEDSDGIRGDLAIELLNKAVLSGVRVVVADGGSSPDFLFAMKNFQNRGITIVNSDTPDRAPQRRRAFEAADLLPGVRVIVYTQPEKVSIMDHLAEISKPILEGSADIVIPSRNLDLFEQTYPDYMRESELRVNKTYDWLMKRAGLIAKDQSFDWFFGPVVFRNDPEIVAFFMKRYKVDGSIISRVGASPNPEMHSDGHYFPIIEALFNKKGVVSVEVPFVYPPTQRVNEISPNKIEEFRKRRKLDGAAYRLEAIHFLEYLKRNPNSKITRICPLDN